MRVRELRRAGWLSQAGRGGPPSVRLSAATRVDAPIVPSLSSTTTPHVADTEIVVGARLKAA